MNDWQSLFPPEVCEVLRIDHPEAYAEVVKAFNNPKGEGPPWWVVFLVTAVAVPVLVLPDPVPGSGVIALGMLTATWWSKLSTYGVQK